ncbi:unnamed protein product [Staurois parvus]|uniref:Uncharacterized protein n=1 Tax=Staurois parvus TaxID=386267 RepID=A0ABN9H152_9NEOB|nr:unnamed protein product [Staurois parvus]
MSVPKAVTPSYTRAYHAALDRESLQHLPCPSLPRCVPCSIPGHLLQLMLASGSCVPVPVTSGRTGAAGGGKIENLKKNFIFFKTILHMLCPVPSAF